MPKDHRRRSLPFFALGATIFTVGVLSRRSRHILIPLGGAVWIVGALLLQPPRSEAP